MVTILYHIFSQMNLSPNSPLLYHQNCASFQTKCVAKRPLNHHFSVNITKILWTNNESLKCSENNKQTKMKRQKRGEGTTTTTCCPSIVIDRWKELWTNVTQKTMKQIINTATKHHSVDLVNETNDRGLKRQHYT